MKRIFRSLIAFLFLALVCTAGLDAQQKKTFTGMEKHDVTLDAAKKMVKKQNAKAKKGAVKGGLFGRNVIEKIFAQPGCVGLRLYYAQTAKGAPTIVIVGVDSTGTDLTSGVLAEDMFPCPPYCGTVSALQRK
ncbi:MAG TPA: hypothetical protein VMM57_02655 [Bacteroidota bacterium]|nr:hypothetical protein [Bacteroidota bacterium]